MRASIYLLVAALVGAMVARAEEAGSAEAHFRTRISPLLERACVKCHGAEKQKGGLRLDSREAALRGGENGAALVPGNPRESLLLKMVQHTLPDGERMPPKEKLEAAEIAEVEHWITAGAPWPTQPPALAAQPPAGEKIGDAWSDPRNPIVRIFGGRRLDLWSLKPIAQPAPPTIRDTAWPRNALDRFHLARLEAEGRKPAPQADPRTLIRRLTFTLTGLPPKPEEVAAFTSDTAPDAAERLVERLLASPRYGEHQARMWLDVIRYADSNGFDWDEFRPQAWRFRDYVIRSLNADKPWDRFIREQLAGDEMLAGAPRDAAEQDSLVATGFLRLGPWDNSAAQFGEQAKVRTQFLADLTETTGAAFLGLTLSCCRCHDHKYDPISQADHYRLRAFFTPIKPADDLPLDFGADREALKKSASALVARLAEARAKRGAVLEPGKARLQKKGTEKPTDDDAKNALTAEEKSLYEKADAVVQALKKEQVPGTFGLLATDAEGKPPATFILEGGAHDATREPVEPGFLSALDPNAAAILPPTRPGSTGRRTALAEWIVSERNPLTARVLVNRIWQAHFGEGLVGTANDFGLAGGRPSDPALLDWLAGEFIRGGWSLKKLHRLILTSATFRQSSPPRRLSAEALRDSMLAVAGQLSERTGGPPIWPELPEEVLKANPAFLDDNAEKTKGWYPSQLADQGARSIFLVQKRNLRVPLLEAFDLPENATSCARRNISTVAPQALTLLNSPFATEQARAFAARVEREAGADKNAQVERALALAFQRAPDDTERAALQRFRREHTLAELCRVLLNLNEFVYAD